MPNTKHTYFQNNGRFRQEFDPFRHSSSTTGVWAHNDDTEGAERAPVKIKFLFTSVKDHVCECIRLGLGLLNTRRTYFPQVGGAKLSISRTSPALADDGFTVGGEEPSWRSRPPPVSRHSWDLLWDSWEVMNSSEHAYASEKVKLRSYASWSIYSACCISLGFVIVPNEAISCLWEYTIPNLPFFLCFKPRPDAKLFSWRCVWIERKTYILAQQRYCVRS